MANNILDREKLVLFDLDGTLIRTPDYQLVDNINTSLAFAGLPIQTEEEILRFYREHKWDETLEVWGLNEEEIKKFWQHYINYVENRTEDGTIIYDDVLSCLERLKDLGLRTGIVSSSTLKYLERQVKKIGIDFFDGYVCVGHRSNNLGAKPSADGIIYLATRLECFPDETVYVGNSDLDILTARNAGCSDVLIDRRENTFSENPSFVIKSLDELR